MGPNWRNRQVKLPLCENDDHFEEVLPCRLGQVKDRTNICMTDQGFLGRPVLSLQAQVIWIMTVKMQSISGDFQNRKPHSQKWWRDIITVKEEEAAEGVLAVYGSEFYAGETPLHVTK